MDKCVDIVLDSFNDWLMRMQCQHYKPNDRTINILLEGMQDLVVEYLHKKKIKYIKIERENEILFGV
nr:hypothetical protein [Cnaphalocrocis medinalis granulovirus]